MIWYPIKDKATVTAWHNDLKDIEGLPETLAVEFYLRPPVNPDVLNGSGLVIVNPPFQLTDNIQAILPAFLHCLTGGKGTAEVVSL
jgi:23S rRNA (adenine2030-N6)-methyltransferase